MLTRWISDLTDALVGAPAPDSNEALRRWLLANPHLALSQYPHTHESHDYPHTSAQCCAEPRTD